MTALPDEIKKLRMLSNGFRAARVLLSANNLGVFEKLKSPKTASQIASALKTDKRATEILLNALAGMGLVKKQKDRYKNSALAEKLLVRGSPFYQGDILRHTENLWRNWSGLDEVIKTGRPNRTSHNHEAFIMGMHNIAVLKAGKVLKSIGLKGIKSALDLGGGPGTYSIEMAKKGISVTLFDYPETIALAKKVCKEVKGIRFLSGDFFQSDIGAGYDLVFISQILHAYSPEDNLKLLDKAKRSLNPDGRVIVQEFYISPELTEPLESALFSVNMLVNTTSGRCYSANEIKDWLLRAGFKSVSEKMLPDTVLIEGRL